MLPTSITTTMGCVSSDAGEKVREHHKQPHCEPKPLHRDEDGPFGLLGRIPNLHLRLGFQEEELSFYHKQYLLGGV